MKQTSFLAIFLVLILSQAVSTTEIRLNSEKANKFLGKTKRWFQSMRENWVEFTEALTDENVRERCYTTPEGCTREQVREKFEDNEQTDEYYKNYKCDKYPDTCTAGGVPYSLS